jgi:hypothetical protein
VTADLTTDDVTEAVGRVVLLLLMSAAARAMFRWFWPKVPR